MDASHIILISHQIFHANSQLFLQLSGVVRRQHCAHHQARDEQGWCGPRAQGSFNAAKHTPFRRKNGVSIEITNIHPYPSIYINIIHQYTSMLYINIFYINILYINLFLYPQYHPIFLKMVTMNPPIHQRYSSFRWRSETLPRASSIMSLGLGHIADLNSYNFKYRR